MTTSIPPSLSNNQGQMVHLICQPESQRRCVFQAKVRDIPGLSRVLPSRWHELALGNAHKAYFSIA